MKRRPTLTAARLVELVGADTALRLVAEWGGHVVPRRLDADRLRRDRRIRAALDAGGSSVQVGADYGLSASRISRIGKRCD